MAKETLPTVVVKATVIDVRPSLQQPPPAHPDWKVRLKREVIVDKASVSKPELGDFFTCFGHDDIKIGIGGKYAFQVTVKQGDTRQLVNITGAILLNEEDEAKFVYPELPNPNAAVSHAPAGGGGTGGGSNGQAIAPPVDPVVQARGISYRVVTDAIVKGKLFDLSVSLGVGGVGIEDIHLMLERGALYIVSGEWPKDREG